MQRTKKRERASEPCEIIIARKLILFLNRPKIVLFYGDFRDFVLVVIYGVVVFVHFPHFSPVEIFSTCSNK